MSWSQLLAVHRFSFVYWSGPEEGSDLLPPPANLLTLPTPTVCRSLLHWASLGIWLGLCGGS